MLAINVLLGILLILIAINDILFYRIEDELIVALLCTFLVFACWRDPNNVSLYPLLYAVIFFFIGAVCNAFGMIGGGDVKMMSALLLFDPDMTELIFVMSISGLVVGAIYYFFGRYISRIRSLLLLSVFSKKECSILYKMLFPSLLYLNREDVAADDTRSLQMKIPYGVVISVGNLLVLCR